MQNPMLKTIADKLGKSQAQVLIRWSHQSGLICIPKSVTPERIAQNAAVLDWVSALCVSPHTGGQDMKCVDVVFTCCIESYHVCPNLSIM